MHATVSFRSSFLSWSLVRLSESGFIARLVCPIGQALARLIRINDLKHLGAYKFLPAHCGEESTRRFFISITAWSTGHSRLYEQRRFWFEITVGRVFSGICLLVSGKAKRVQLCNTSTSTAPVPLPIRMLQ